MVQPLWKTLRQFLTKLKALFLYNPVTVLLGTYSKELKIYVHTKTCIQMFKVAWFIIAKIWKPLRCPSVDKRIKLLWHIQTMKYYSQLKRNELSSHEETYRNLKYILLSERHQSTHTTYTIISIISHYGKSRTMETIKKNSGCQRLRKRERWTGRMQRIFTVVKLFCILFGLWMIIC